MLKIKIGEALAVLPRTHISFPIPFPHQLVRFSAGDAGEIETKTATENTNNNNNNNT